MFEEELNNLLSQKPANGTPEEIEKWRKKVKAAREKSDKEYEEWVKKVEEQWKDDEWEAMREKLKGLSLEELREIASATGIKFSIGNEKIMDREEFILVLDEADKNDLMDAYKKIIQKRQ